MHYFSGIQQECSLSITKRTSILQPKTEGREVKVTDEDRSENPVNSRTRSLAGLLFSANKEKKSSDSGISLAMSDGIESISLQPK